jgi:hypothetical protein
MSFAGMSGDFELAIRMGSTSVRIGSTIFGARSVCVRMYMCPYVSEVTCFYREHTHDVISSQVIMTTSHIGTPSASPRDCDYSY